MTKRLLKLEKQGCAPCVAVQNYLESKGVEVRKVDVFESPEIAGMYDISGVPVTILLDGDDEVERSTGFNPLELDKLISQL